MSSFIDIAEQHRQHMEDLGVEKRRIIESVEAANPDISPPAARALAEEQILTTYPPDLQKYGYSMGRKTLAWFAIGDMYVDAIQNMDEEAAESQPPFYDEIREYNRNAIQAGSAWFANIYSALWDEQTACSVDDRNPASLRIGAFDPYAVEEQAWMTGLLTAMTLRLQTTDGHGEHSAAASFTVPENNWEVELSRTSTAFADEHRLVIAEAYGPSLQKTRVTEYTVGESEERVWGRVVLPDESTTQLMGLTALELASEISADPLETIRTAKDPITRRARLFAAAEQENR